MPGSGPAAPETVAIPARFNGPPTSANGGFTCGTVARLLGADAAEINLRTPPPLDTPLAVVREDAAVSAFTHSSRARSGAQVAEPGGASDGGTGSG